MQNLPSRLTTPLLENVLIVLAAAVLVAAVLGCSTTQKPADDPGREVPPQDSLPEEDARTAPWQNEPLSAGAVPNVYVDRWQEAENRDKCALIAPVSLEEGEPATVRSAYFAGGWGIAYDMPGLRSAFGVAGTGADAAGPSYDEWPFMKEWPDGSSVGYGPEGGSGPNQLAYLRIPGQDCLYNVWSRLGVDHLETLLDQLRFVQTRL